MLPLTRLETKEKSGALLVGFKVSVALNHWYQIPGRGKESKTRESEDLSGQGADDLEDWVGMKILR